MTIKICDCIKTPRFGYVRIGEIFSSEAEARDAGYTEPTHYNYENDEWNILGKFIGINQYAFAAARINAEK